MSEWDGVDRRKPIGLTEAQIDEIAERAAEVALEKVYTAVGKSVVHKVLWLAGATTLAISAWANAHGWFAPK